MRPSSLRRKEDQVTSIGSELVEEQADRRRAEEKQRPIRLDRS